ncbi:hypothetical protein BH11PLA2_BH11PLA2_12140 [soil metagenome]
MASSSSILPYQDEPTTVVRVSSSLSAVTMDGLPPRLPTLPGLYTPGPFGAPATYIQVPGYDVIRELGRGGMGVVYLARHLKLDRYVALKMVIARQYAGREEQARFRQEVEAVAKLNHPSIAQVYEVGEHDGFSYAAFEYVDGGTLLQWQKQKPQHPRDAARLISTIARAVQHAHDHGIIHRDLKPANVLIASCDSRVADSKNREHGDSASRVASGIQSEIQNSKSAISPKITDFGLAKKLDQASDLTATGMACGTPNYMAPEQIHGKQAQVSPATDVYGLGAILFELLTAKPPFSGDTPMSTMQAVMHDPPTSVRKHVAETPRDLEVIVAKCLEKDPARRYITAAELAEDLDRHLENRPILARGVGRIERGRRWMQRNPYPTALMASLLVGCVATAALAVNLWQTVQSERHSHEVMERALTAARVAQGDATEARTLAEASGRNAESRRVEAESSRNAALKSKQEAEAALKKAEAAARISDAERIQAAENLATATKLVDTIVERFAGNQEFRDDEQLPLRRWMISQAYQSLIAIRKQDPGNPEIQHKIIRTTYHFGRFSYGIGDFDKAFEHYLDAQDAMGQMVKWYPKRADWQLDYAKFSLELIHVAYMSKSLARLLGSKYLDDAHEAMDAVEKLDPNPATREMIRQMKAREEILRAFEAAYRSESNDAYIAQARKAYNAARVLFPGGKPLPGDVELYGELLLRLANIARYTNDPAAPGYFEQADQLYDNARRVWFPQELWTRWDVRWVIARKAHGLYWESRGQLDLAAAILQSSQVTMEKLVEFGSEIASSREELAEAFLATIFRTVERDKNFDPTPNVRRIELLLAPTWRLKNPSDLARHTMADSHLLAARWCGEQSRHREAAQYYLKAAQDWRHGLNEDKAIGLLRRVSQAHAGAAAHLAQSGQRNMALDNAMLAIKADPECTVTRYHVARMWSILAASATGTAEDKAEALASLKAADDGRYFSVPGYRKQFETAAEFDWLRNEFTPQNLKP